VAAEDLLHFYHPRGNALSADQYQCQEQEEEDEEEDPHFTTQVTNQLKKSCPNNSSFASVTGNASSRDNYSGSKCKDEYINDNCKTAVTNRLGNGEQARDNVERQTVNLVFDECTNLIIHKMTHNNVIQQLTYCISTGKEACVYHAFSELHGHCAVKIYKVSTAKFKNREPYILGNYRYRKGYSKTTRKMVELWAEKERGNLMRLAKGGIMVPTVHFYKKNVLVMTFIGNDEFCDGPAPLLKDAKLSRKEFRKLYRQLCDDMWTMYNKCNLVHADLSEFNILYHNRRACIIDVSQSVSSDHVGALSFLRSDCSNIISFFRKQDVATVTLRELFLFIVDKSITEDNKSECWELLNKAAEDRGVNGLSEEQKLDEEVFKDTYLPQNFSQVVDFERDWQGLRDGSLTVDDLQYQAVVGMNPKLSGPSLGPAQLVEEEEENQQQEEEDVGNRQKDLGNPSKDVKNQQKDEEKRRNVKDLQKEMKKQQKDVGNGQEDVEKRQKDVKERLCPVDLSEIILTEGMDAMLKPKAAAQIDSDEEGEEEDNEAGIASENPLLHPDRARNETTEERSARKKLVKEQKSEKRKNKVPKAVKKRATKKK